jgi:hypothetical protein
MATRIHLSRKGYMRSDQDKNKKKTLMITAAKYLNDFTIALTFSDGKKRLVDFLPLFHKYVKGDNLKYFNIEKFKKFFVKNGTLYWGRNEDVIFTLDILYEGLDDEEEVLYIL